MALLLIDVSMTDFDIDSHRGQTPGTGGTRRTDKQVTGGQSSAADPFAVMRAHKRVLAAIAGRDDRAGASAKCLIRVVNRQLPWTATVAASHFACPEAETETAARDAWCMAPNFSVDWRENLAEYAEEFEAAARDAEDPAVRDANLVLAALAQGEDPPRDAAERVVRRAEDDDGR